MAAIDPASQVNNIFSLAQGYASANSSACSSFTSALSGASFSPPTHNFTWTGVAGPSISAPTSINDGGLTTINWSAPTEVADLAINPAAIDATLGGIEPFDVTAPTINIPSVPTISYGAVPTVPTITNVTVPDMPTIDLATAPTFLSISAPAFTGVDLHEEYLSHLDNIPTLNLLCPTPYTFAPDAKYTDSLITALSAKLLDRVTNGGTGLNPTVEQAIWDRGRSRETEALLAAEADIVRNSEALGYALPSGTLAMELTAARQNYWDKLSALSRDVSIKQAELEQENVKHAIQQGIALEGQLIDQAIKMEQLSFEASKAVADVAIQKYNAEVGAYRELLHSYEVFATAYKTVIEGEQLKIEGFKAQIEAEKAKAMVNDSLVRQFEAQIKFSVAQVDLYKTEVEAAATRMGLEKAKIDAAKAQIEGFVATVNAETAKIQGYKAQADVETARVGVYSEQVKAYTSRANVEIEKAKTKASVYEVQARVYSAKVQGYSAKVDAEKAKMQAIAGNNEKVIGQYKAYSDAVSAHAQAAVAKYGADVKQYEAAIQAGMQSAKINGDFAMGKASLATDAAKVGAQVYAQLTASSYGMMRVQAGISGSDSTVHQYQHKVSS